MTSPYRGTSLGRELRTLRRSQFPTTYGFVVLACFALGAGMVGLTFTETDVSRAGREALLSFGALFAGASALVGTCVVLVGRARPRYSFHELGFEVERREMKHVVLWRDVTRIDLHGVTAGTPPAAGAFTYVVHGAHVAPIVLSSLDFDEVDAAFGEWLCERAGVPIS